MIPKKIHYCWFSGRPVPKEFEKYIDSWKKYCPDYEIIRWDESNYDVTKNAYMASAYKEKRWGFVPDYARFDIIYREGGIYLDTDVELIKPLDELLDNHCYLGFETTDIINAGLGFGAEKGNPVIGALRDMYEDISFYNEDGSLNLVPSPTYITNCLVKQGVRLDGSLKRQEQLTVYPVDYFAPKDYCTGILRLSDNTYSIHHFSCTWMTREEKLAEERRLLFCNKFGDYLGNRVDGAYKRVKRLSEAYKHQLTNGRNLPERALEHFFFSDKKNEARLNAFENAPIKPLVPPQKVVLLTPAVKTDNLGDEFIEQSCISNFPIDKTSVVGKISTHTHPSHREQSQMKSADLLLVTGSNLLGSDVRHSQWKLPTDFSALSGLCLMGCGWSRYKTVDDYSARFYRRLLNNGLLHSVRDQHTLKQLQAIGVENVLYTGCPTMWNLTPEHCQTVPTSKSGSVVTALTWYQPDRLKDGQQLQTLFSLYKKVYFWPQSREDTSYLMSLLTRSEKEAVTVLPRDWGEMKALLNEEHPDYVGNRLHAGIFALNCGCRSRIVAIDNRAAEIGNDTGLPTIARESLNENLEKAIEDKSPLSLQMPWENIRLWKQQFEKGMQ